jgi:PIN domain nuclease of toxin-antitoxin system
MNCLIDTHILLWSAISPEKISSKINRVLLLPENNLMVSPVSFWEISIKYSMGKLQIQGLTPEDFPRIAGETGFDLLPLTVDDFSTFHNLKRTAHRDPFDRMLAWQAIRNDLILITQYPDFKVYIPSGLQILK